MASPEERILFDLEKKFWRALVDQDTDTALSLLCEPALVVSSHGAMRFDHPTYRKMAEQGTMTVKSFQISDMQAVFPNASTAVLIYRVEQQLAPRAGGDVITQRMCDSSTWVKEDARWLCVMHTETALDPATAG